ncbi:cobalt-zinc-cadmium resistance protein CzcA [Klebsiella variicola]|uniref:Cobalt-zinc-cadmium resistance protein CzcA n=1 Tax=Klebsiella variicola TaxID=244366 RepID=A0A7H4MG39_KLEVA|nr:cobalt-zinc-cadmium resistance protein CzcA [Klebsiella variicola]
MACSPLLNIGRLEDPAFTIKTAVIVTHYPGASAQQVEEEVTLPLENAIQQLPSLDNVSSISSNGLSQITVNIASQYHSSELPQIWDELRRRVGDASRLFPPGVVPSFVNDDFGDVFAFSSPFRATVLPILSWCAMPSSCAVSWCWCRRRQSRHWRRDSTADHVDISLAKMAARGITLNQLAAILTRLNVVSSAGEIRAGSESIRLHPTGEFQNIDELGDLLVSPHGASATTRLRDIGHVVARADRLSLPVSIMPTAARR